MPVVRVRVSAGEGGRVSLSGSGGVMVECAQAVLRVGPDEVVEFWREGVRVAAGRSGGVWQRGLDTVVVRGTGGCLLRLSGRRYRGELVVFAASDSGLAVVNRLGIEEYLYGVLPRELGAAGPECFEAAKAQAVAARSFALARLGRRQGLGHDLFDSHTRDQEYGGAGVETDWARQAVDATRGEVLTFEGAPVMALYHANCGGVTGNGSEPYLTSVSDVPGRGRPAWCSGGKWFEWEVVLPAESVARTVMRLARLGRMPVISGWRLERDEMSGRVRRVRFETGGSWVTVGANELRMGLGLRSTLFELRRQGSGFCFSGRGWGHGVGLCQEGALARARAGQGYPEILAAYYRGVVLERRW